MKKTIAFIALVLCFSASAQEVQPRVELNSSSLDINFSSAIVVRTNSSPETIELTFKVPMEKSICERYETRQLLRTSGTYCGFDIIERRIRDDRQCEHRNPHNNECLRWVDRFRVERVQLPRTCMVPDTFCAQYGTATLFQRDNMRIKFKDLPVLADSETETFSIVATQKRFDSGLVIFEVKPLETLREYRVKRKKILFFNTDTYVIEEK